jgi:hypothetical protein
LDLVFWAFGLGISLSPATTRRVTQDTGLFFCFHFLSRARNEETMYEKSLRIGGTSAGPAPEVAGLV